MLTVVSAVVPVDWQEVMLVGTSWPVGDWRLPRDGGLYVGCPSKCCAEHCPAAVSPSRWPVVPQRSCEWLLHQGCSGPADQCRNVTGHSWACKLYVPRYVGISTLIADRRYYLPAMHVVLHRTG